MDTANERAVLQAALAVLSSQWQYTSIQRRDAAATLAQFAVPEAINALITALYDPDPAIRRTALQSLQRIGDPARPQLLAALNHDQVLARRGAVQVLGDIGARETSQDLMWMARHDQDWSVRAAAAAALGKLREQGAIRVLSSILQKEDNTEVREAAVMALADIGGPRARRLIKKALKDDHAYVRTAAEIAIDRLDRPRK
jgi:HEAT repeat protein